MTDQTSSGPVVAEPRERQARPPTREFYAYFALIFLAAIPFALFTWGLKTARQMRLPSQGPLAMAWTQARIITPKIFWA